MARGSVENVITALRTISSLDPHDYDIHLNFPGGIPTDGPSAGASMAVAIYSAIHNLAVDNTFAFTGEVSIRGDICPVGGVQAKLEAAWYAGAKQVFIPKDNWMKSFGDCRQGKVTPVTSLRELIKRVFGEDQVQSARLSSLAGGGTVSQGVFTTNPM